MKKIKLYLREIIAKERFGNMSKLDIFEGDINDIKKDKLYWKKYQNCETRYFELKEKKI